LTVDSEEQYIRDQLGLVHQKKLKALVLLTGGLFLFFMIFDWYLSPAILLRFLPHRIIVSLIMLLLIFLGNRRSDLEYQQRLTIAGVTAVAATIEIISISFKEHHYFYYNGMNLIVIGALGFLPIGAKLSLTLMGIIYAIFVLPVAIFEPESLTVHPFIMLNAYFLSTCVLAYTWRISHQKTFVDWLKVQYALYKDKTSLQGVVDSQSRTIEKSEVMLGEVMSNASDGIIIMDRKGSILKANPSACEIYNHKGIVGENICSISERETRQIWEQLLEKIELFNPLLFEVVHHEGTGAKKIFEISANMIRIGDEEVIQAIHRDLTERRKLEQQVLIAQKMESVGVLACGIAHDFKNVLSTVQSFADYVRSVKPDVPEWHKRITESADLIEEELKGASQVISQLLSLGRRRDVEFQVFDVNETINHTVKLYSKIMLQVKMTMHLDSSLPRIYGNRGLIEQMLANMIINANEAMPDGGKLFIASELVDDKVSGVGLSEGGGNIRYAKIAVSDDGVGIAEEHVPHIFDPFYTTKADNVKPGTGLGLSMVYGIVKAHGGKVTVESVLGEGTCFSCYLPATDGSDISQGSLGKRNGSYLLNSFQSVGLFFVTSCIGLFFLNTMFGQA
jgi:PAS domain S-box-containing protein